MQEFVDAVQHGLDPEEIAIFGSYVGGGIAAGYYQTKQRYRDRPLDDLDETLSCASTPREAAKDVVLASYRLGQLSAYYSMRLSRWREQRLSEDAYTGPDRDMKGEAVRSHAAAHGIDDSAVQTHLERTIGGWADREAEKRIPDGLYVPDIDTIILPDTYDAAHHRHETQHRKRRNEAKRLGDLQTEAFLMDSHTERVAEYLGVEERNITTVEDEDLAAELDVPAPWTRAAVLPSDTFDSAVFDRYRQSLMAGTDPVDYGFDELITGYVEGKDPDALVSYYGFDSEEVERADRSLRRIDRASGFDLGELHTRIENVTSLPELEEEAADLPAVEEGEDGSSNRGILVEE